MKVEVRWMIRRDMEDILAIEKTSFEFPWGDADFVGRLRQKNCIGMVAEFDDEVVGFMIYELHKQRLHLLNFAVAARVRRQGVGRQLVEKLISKLSYQRRSQLQIEIRETNLGALNFFKAQGFRAVSVLQDFYDDTDEDAYLMQYRVYRSESPAASVQQQTRYCD